MLAQADRTDVLPRVSIGMPVYNGERWLEGTIEALLTQSLSDFELIISDNASTDATQSICDRLVVQDRRIRYYRNAQNIGANRNYVSVLVQARAAYFKWASSNDLCERRFLERCVATLEAAPDAVLAYPRTMLFKSDPEDAVPFDGDLAVMQESAADRFAYVLCNMTLNNAMNGVLRTSSLRRISPMGNFHSADIVMMAELTLLGKFVQIPEPLFFRRMSEESATALRARCEVERHFEPGATAPLHWQRWKFQLRVWRGALLVAPPGLEKMRALIFALKSTVWGRSQLLGEIVAAVRSARRRSPSSRNMTSWRKQAKQ